MNQLKLFLLFVMLSADFGSATVAQEEPVWFWFATCGGPALTLEVQFDKTMIYKSTFPLCRAERRSVESQGGAGRVQFYFWPQRTIEWSGYRETNETTKANQAIEGDLWQAGADPDDLLIGISFSDDSKIYMNTIHIAHPARRDQTTVATGLVVTTYPAGN